jgi:D-serine deaminase-like pyridoxal phosphate-dependent protein
MYNDLSTPAVIIDLDTVERNIAKMAAQLKKAGIAHRPHIKTHKSVRLAKLQQAAGAIGITVAKLAEAEVFAEAGFTDILIAIPILGEQKLKRFSSIHQNINVTATVDSLVVAKGLSRVGMETGKPVPVLIELDGGLHRGGRQPGDDIVSFACEISDLPGIKLLGIMAYFGQIYREKNVDDLTRFVRGESELIKQVVRDLNKAGIPVQIVSSGSSPSSILSDELLGVNEVRAGNYIFFDASAVQMGLAEEQDCALRVIATVISTPLPGRATIDAGTKTLTSDKAHHREGFGIVVNQPGVEVIGLNEEHGMLSFDPAAVQLSVGDRIEIIPNHSCVVPNLYDNVYGVREQKVVEIIHIDARGRND